MSYNITSVKIKSESPVVIDVEELVLTALHYGLDNNLRNEIGIDNYQLHDNGDRTIEITTFLGHIQGKMIRKTQMEVESVSPAEYTSDYTIADFIREQAQKNKSSVQIITVWEGGDSIYVDEVENGVVIKKDEELA